MKITLCNKWELSPQKLTEVELKRQLRKVSYCWHANGCRHEPVCDPVCQDVVQGTLPF